MLTPTRLNELVRELGKTRVLTVYHGARVTDPAMRHSWRAELTAALQPVRNAIATDAERADFDRAAAFLNDPFPPIDGVWGMPGWAAFLTAEGPRYAGTLPVEAPTIAAWRDGPVITPYLRALKQHRPVIVAIVDSRSARLYRYAVGSLTALPGLSLTAPEHDGTGSPMRSVARSGVRAPGAPRGTLDAEQLRRRRTSAFQRLAADLATRLTELAGDEGWILIGGTREWAHLAGNAMPAHLDGRVMVSSALDHNEHEQGIAVAARHAGSQLRAAHGLELVERIAESSGAGGRGVIGVPAVQRALHASAVDQLLVSPRFLQRSALDVEDMVRAALARGASVEVLSGIAAEQLDDRSEGIAARLRFAIDAPLRTLQPEAGLVRAEQAAPRA